MVVRPTTYFNGAIGDGVDDICFTNILAGWQTGFFTLRFFVDKTADM